MMATADRRAILNDLKTRIGAVAVALVSRDGLSLHADLPIEAHAETFAMMCATMLGAATFAHSELNRDQLRRVVVEGDASRTIIVPCGTNALLVAVVGTASDQPFLPIALSKALLEAHPGDGLP